MKNRALEVTYYSTIAIVLIGFFFYRSRSIQEVKALKARNKKSFVLQSLLAVEKNFVDYQFPDFSLTTENEEDVALYSILSSSEINILIVITSDGCSACRDLEIERWALFDRQYNDTSMFLLIAGEYIHGENKQRVMYSELPAYFRENLIEEMRILPEHTPLVFFVSSTGKVLFCYRGHFDIQERSEHIISLIKLAMEIKDCE